MKKEITYAILPELPIVGKLKLSSADGKSLASIDVVKSGKETPLTPFFENCYKELLNYLSGKSQYINIELDHEALTPFQKQVLKEMKKIPYGKVATYKDLAVKMKSRAYQAIGSACGKNPFILIYPCHRVVGSDGPGGFAHGLKMKKELLKLESPEFHS